MRNAAGFVELGKQVFGEFSDKNVSFMAAGIAYNAFVSLAPLLIVLMLLVSVIGGGLEARFIDAANTSLPGPIADVVIQIFSGGTAASVSIVGIVVLVWGTLKIFRSMDTAFSEIYETERDNTFVEKLSDALIVIVALGFSVFATIGVSAVFARLSADIPVLGVLIPFVLMGGLLFAFYPMYYHYPDVDLGWKEVLPGALVAALGWAVLQGVFQIYLIFRSGGAESIFGSVIVLVTWLYFSGLILLLGAVLNAVIGGYAGGVSDEAEHDTAGDAGGVYTRKVLTEAETADYLGNLREHLTTRRGVMELGNESADGTPELHDDADIREFVRTLRKTRPAILPDDEVAVIEWSHPDAGERMITFSWHYTTHPGVQTPQPDDTGGASL